ncbi:hypothetical protein [Leptospira sp. 'Mane']|uniref:hypothetical protein n=1 Tax=Leptospira sp. 'Mane' TaxID=3387407 RepID=UPI00398B676F
MYSSVPGLVFGFHGCDEEVANSVISGKLTLSKSENSYDWLGHGIYFWEGNYSRALEYAQLLQSNPKRNKGKIKKPAVIGAIIDLGNCLNLLESESIDLLKESYNLLSKSSKTTGNPLPENKSIDLEKDLLLRNLDCAVIENLHAMRKELELPVFDSVRGYFREGKEIYPNAGFHDKNHIQLCIRNPKSIKGYFKPLI